MDYIERRKNPILYWAVIFMWLMSAGGGLQGYIFPLFANETKILISQPSLNSAGNDSLPDSAEKKGVTVMIAVPENWDKREDNTSEYKSFSVYDKDMRGVVSVTEMEFDEKNSNFEEYRQGMIMSYSKNIDFVSASNEKDAANLFNNKKDYEVCSVKSYRGFYQGFECEAIIVDIAKDGKYYSVMGSYAIEDILFVKLVMNTINSFQLI